MHLLNLPWRQFLSELQASNSEQEVWDLLKTEQRGKRRLAVMTRLYQRASKLRRAREHEGMLSYD